jgi:hypothetical protein
MERINFDFLLAGVLGDFLKYFLTHVVVLGFLRDLSGLERSLSPERSPLRLGPHVLLRLLGLVVLRLRLVDLLLLLGLLLLLVDLSSLRLEDVLLSPGELSPCGLLPRYVLGQLLLGQGIAPRPSHYCRYYQ